MALPKGALFGKHVEFLKDSDVAVVVAEQGDLLFINVLTRKLLMRTPCSRSKGGDRFTSISVGPSGKYLTASTHFGYVELFDVEFAIKCKADVARVQRKAERVKELNAVLEGIGNDHTIGSSLDAAIEATRALPDNLPDPSPLYADSVSVTPESSRSATPSFTPAASVETSPAKADVQAKAVREFRPIFPAADAEQDKENDGTESNGDVSVVVGRKPFGGPARGEDDRVLPFVVPDDTAPLEGSRLEEINPKLDILHHPKLAGLLKRYGCYPDKYRTHIWRFLLQLPRNTPAYEALAAKGTHVAWKEFKGFTVRDSRIGKKLRKLLSALTHWCPLFAEVSFLPALCYPFLKLFQHSDLDAFEITVAVLCNWSRKWFEYFPSPPVAIVQGVEALLKHHDRPLWTHLVATSGSEGLQKVFWGMLSSFFANVLTRKEWLCTMDHLLSNQPAFLLHLIVSYLITMRNSLLSVVHAKEVEHFCNHQNAISDSMWHEKAYALQDSTPKYLLPSDMLKYLAMTPGAYPVFATFYPAHVVDFHLQERERIAMDEEDIERGKQVVALLGVKNAEIEAAHTKWQAQQEAAIQAEHLRRHRSQLEEEGRTRERDRIDLLASERRLQQISLLEQTAQTYMEQDEQQRLVELLRREEEFTTRRAREDKDLQRQKQEENLLNLEWQSHQRMRDLQADQARKLLHRNMGQEQQVYAKKQELETAKTREAWKTEDEERRLRLQVESNKAADMERFNQDLQAKRAFQRTVAVDELERQLSLAAIERERRMRALAQDQIVAAESEKKETEHRTRLLAFEEEHIQQLLVNNDREWRERQAQEKVDLVRDEQTRAKAEEKERTARIEEIEHQQRIREFEEDLRTHQEGEKQRVREEEAEVHRVLVKMQEQSHEQRRLELDLGFKEQKLQEKAAFQRALREMELKVVEEERHRYESIRENLGHRMTAEEKALITAHEDEMARCIVERERQLWALNEEVRAGVQAEELVGLQASYKQHEAKVDRLRKDFAEREDKIRRRIDALDPVGSSSDTQLRGQYAGQQSGPSAEGYTSSSSHSSHPSSQSLQPPSQPSQWGQREEWVERNQRSGRPRDDRRHGRYEVAAAEADVAEAEAKSLQRELLHKKPQSLGDQEAHEHALHAADEILLKARRQQSKELAAARAVLHPHGHTVHKHRGHASSSSASGYGSDESYSYSCSDSDCSGPSSHTHASSRSAHSSQPSTNSATPLLTARGDAPRPAQHDGYGSTTSPAWPAYHLPPPATVQLPPSSDALPHSHLPQPSQIPFPHSARSQGSTQQQTGGPLPRHAEVAQPLATHSTQSRSRSQSSSSDSQRSVRLQVGAHAKERFSGSGVSSSHESYVHVQQHQSDTEQAGSSDRESETHPSSRDTSNLSSPRLRVGGALSENPNSGAPNFTASLNQLVEQVSAAAKAYADGNHEI
jgi:hypothetical protein